MKNRFLCLFLTICLSLCLLNISVSATDTAFEANLSGEEDGIIGEQYFVFLEVGNFKENEFLGVTAYIDYDASVFEIDSTYLGIMNGTVKPENINPETYPLIDPEEGWVFWGNNSINGDEGTLSVHILNDSTSISSLKGESVVCFIEFKVKDTASIGESVIKIDTDDELKGVFSETLVESKNGTGSSLYVNVMEPEPDFLILKEDSTYSKKFDLIPEKYIITGFKERTNVADFISNFENKVENLNLITDLEILQDTDYVPTGATIQLFKKGEIIDSAIVICMGDVDCTGFLDSTDYLQIKRYFLKSIELSETSLIAADVDGNGEINGTDYLRIKNYFLGKLDIYS